MDTMTTPVTLTGPISLEAFARDHNPRALEWADAFVLSRERVGAAELGKYYRMVKDRDLVAVGPGICLPGQVWSGLAADERNLAQIRALALTHRSPIVFGAESGAALWRLPIIGAWPGRPTILGDRAAGGRSTPRLIRRCEGLPAEIWVVDGLATTALARTVVDVARYSTFGVAVAMADRALAEKRGEAGGALSCSVSRIELLDALAKLEILHGNAKATAVIAFADGNSGSAGESISRVAIHRLGFPPPVLQFVFHDAQGRMIVDFWWPDYNLIGEFDGRGKYLRDEYTLGRSTAEVVIAEKERENRLRAQGPTVVRWGWEEAMAPPLLRRKLLAAGLPLLT
jgi:hypothetical protein